MHTRAPNRSPTNGEQTLGLKYAQGFAKGWAGNDELLHQYGLGRQLISVLDVAFHDLTS